MELIRAKIEEGQQVIAFYHNLIKALRGTPCFPDWEIGVYPQDSSLLDSIAAGELWLCKQDSHILGAMVLNRRAGDEYDRVTWGKTVPRGRYSVIHTLCVDPVSQGKGVAKAMVRHALQTAKAQGDMALRLDVLKGNDPAVSLYTGCGFVYVDTVQMIYDDKGAPEFMLFEHNF